MNSRRLTVAAVLTILLQTLSLPMVAAGKYVEFTPFESSPDKDFIRDYMFTNDSGFQAGVCKLDGKVVSYFDLNGDGTDELFLKYDSACGCGNSSCSVMLFEKRVGKWTQIAEFGALTVEIENSRVKGYRSFTFWWGNLREDTTYTLKWDGEKYR